MRRFALILFVVLIVCAVYLVSSNNQDVAMPSEPELRAHHEKSVEWMLSHRDEILASTNNILWWMVMRSADLTQDTRLQALFAEYKRRQLDPNPSLIWQHYYNRNSMAPVIFSQLTNLPPYNLFFVYGLTCDRELGEIDIIKQQQQANFCSDNQPLSPACVTHQMMGARFMLERNCGDAAEIRNLIRALQDKVVGQLTWDARVVDVYLQRVLMLTDTGAAERVKPVWVRNILEAQHDDGGWSPTQAFIGVGKERAFGFIGRGIGIGSTRTDFHATAQGLLLLSLLLEPKTP